LAKLRVMIDIHIEDRKSQFSISLIGEVLALLDI
jgi:hypothetical protein